MKLFKREQDGWTFQFSFQEMEMLRHVLRLYPRTPQSYQKLSKEGGRRELEDGQALLEEALADRKRENKKKVEEFLADEDRIRSTESHALMTIQEGEMDWLLQVLNDVRVGAWLRLGSPKHGDDLPEEWDPIRIQDQSAMQLSGLFEAFLLDVLDSGN